MSPVDIGIVERALQELIKEWERFFACIRKTPPQTERERIARRLRMLMDPNQVALRNVEHFRVEQLQHRFMTYSQMWERMLREREEGRGRSIAVKRATARVEAASKPRTSTASSRGANASPGASVDQNSAAALYERYAAAKKSVGQSVGVDEKAFAAQVNAQRRSMEARLGSGVRFEVVVDEGRVKLTARKSTNR